MKRLLVSMDEERYDDLRRLAFEKKAPMADLVRYALEKVFEDQLDSVRVQRGIEHYAKHPEDYLPLEQVLEELRVELPRHRPAKRRARSRTAASPRRRAS
jgi:predicted DNA-binding protein